MVETAYNRGPFIDSANRRYAYLGAPYCASAASLILDKSKALAPKVRSGRAKAFIVDGSINARLFWEGKIKAPDTCLIIFTRKGGGHIEFMVDQLTGGKAKATEKEVVVMASGYRCRKNIIDTDKRHW
jgi:hypothetical protein